jgi:hypothetical protein
MARAWRLMGHYNAETATYSACAGSAQTSPYTPDFSGRLVGLKTQSSLAAATSLTGHIQFRLSCTTFKPNSIEAYAQGHGLETAPAKTHPANEFSVDQPVQAGVPITVEGRCVDSVPVTVETYVYGCFDVA